MLVPNAGWSGSYASGDRYQGPAGSDSLQIGDLNLNPTFAVVNAVPGSNSTRNNWGIDGIIGLAGQGSSVIGPTPVNNFLTNIEPMLPQSVFTMDCAYDIGAPATFNFGGFDGAGTNGSIFSLAVTPSNVHKHWGVACLAAGFNGGSVSISSDTACQFGKAIRFRWFNDLRIKVTDTFL